MTDEKRRPTLTIVGMPAPTFEDPFPLQSYRDIHYPTPSHQRPLRERGEVTPVYVQPRRADPPRKLDRTITLRSRVRAEPTAHSKRMAAVFVCWALAIWTALAYGGWLPPD